MRYLHRLAVVIAAAAAATASAQTRDIRVFLRCDAEKMEIVIDGDETLKQGLTLDHKRHYWRTHWEGPASLTRKSVGSLRLFGGRTFARTPDDVVPDPEINGNVAAFTFRCNSQPVVNLLIKPSPSIHFSYCRRMGKDDSDPKDTHNKDVAESWSDKRAAVIGDWDYENETIWLLLHSTDRACSRLGLLLNNLPIVRSKSSGDLTVPEIHTARCLQYLKGGTSPPTLACLRLEEEAPADLKVHLEMMK